ncbi:MAG: transglycosylase domain-containing protein [Acidimicrobiales bacterium]
MAELLDRLAARFSTFLRVVVAVAVGLAIVPPAMAGIAAATLLYAPLPTGELPEEQPKVSAVPSVVSDADGQQIATFRSFDRTVEVAPSEVPDIVNDAVIAIEDQRFWEHDGVDVEGIGRAARTNLELGEVAQGGSTITQQYVKNVYLSREQTLERKVEEALLAIELEKQLSKEEILFGYLTTSYFGEGAYGIGAAAMVYFGKDVADLDTSEAATLAGLVQAPTRLSPRNDLEATERRRRLVLQAMADQGYLSRQDLEREMARRLWFAESDERPGGPVTVLAPRPPNGATDHQFFVDWVEQDLLERFGPDLVYQGGLTIETTIDPTLQAEAEDAVAKRLENTEFPVEMSLVSIAPDTGHVVAMVGGRDYDFSQVNLATGGSTGFQPGSSFKPIVLAAAFNLGTGPETTYPAPAQWHAPNCGGDQCTISNYDYADRGEITLRQAMVASVNTVFAQLVIDVTIEDTVELARRLGLERMDPDRQYGASLSLGAAESSPVEMASAYGTFANHGVRQPPTGIARVVDADGNVLVDNRNRAGVAVLDPAVADNVTDVLVEVVENGTGKRARLDRPVAGKTGTAQDYRAAWFVGYTPDLATAVWMGHADRLESLRRVNGVGAVTGGSHPAIAWRDFMAAAHEGTEPTPFVEPAELEPLAETAEEVFVIRPKEETIIGSPRTTVILPDDCGGQSCWQNEQPERPSVPRPEQPVTTTIPPPTTPSTEPAPTTAASQPPTE